MQFVGDNLIQGDADHWEMMAQKCGNCGKVAYPKKRVCPECFETDLRDLPLSKRGILHTFTVTRIGSPELKAPYILALVDAPEGVKIMGQVTVPDPLDHKLKVGMPVEYVLRTLRHDPDGTEVVSFMFKPVED